jgi:hypothetical protein
MNVEVQTRAKALHERDGASFARASEGATARAIAIAGRLGENWHERGQRFRVKGGEPPQLEGEREYPLAYGNIGYDSVHEVRGGVGHQPHAMMRAGPRSALFATRGIRCMGAK